jgi:hypothetical protein
MKFNTPQKDIDFCLEVENSVPQNELPLYLECLNNKPLSERLLNPEDSDFEGRDIRDGCILTHIFLTCRPPLE